MFELLMGLPLFRGVSRQRLAEVVGTARFHFLKFPDGEPIIRAGEDSSHLTFVIGGQVRVTIANDSGRFVISSTLEAPAVIAPDFLFGRITRYPCSVTAIGSVSILKISKSDFIKIIYQDQVFMFNFVNTLSVNAQKSVHGLMSLTTGSLEERIAFWIIALTQPGSFDIRMSCRTRDLCSIFNVPRGTFEAVMADMEQRGLLRYNSNEITVLDRRKMLALIDRQTENHEDMPSRATVTSTTTVS